MAVNKTRHKGLAGGLNNTGIGAAPIFGFCIVPYENDSISPDGKCFCGGVYGVSSKEMGMSDEEIGGHCRVSLGGICTIIPNVDFSIRLN